MDETTCRGSIHHVRVQDSPTMSVQRLGGRDECCPYSDLGPFIRISLPLCPCSAI